MDKPDLHQFIKGTEETVDPKAVGRLYQRAEMLSRLPVGVQKWIVGRASGHGSDIGFVVEPYSLFLAYEIEDEAAAGQAATARLRLVPTAMFEGTEPRLCGIVARIQRAYLRVLGQPRRVLAHRREQEDGHAVVGHVRLRVEHHQLRPGPRVLGREHESFRGHHGSLR